MKITINLDENSIEDEVVINCKSLNESVSKIQKAINEVMEKAETIELNQSDKTFYIPVKEVLFFETNNDMVCAHTSKEIYTVKYRLYELEKILPWYFTRVSKSSILNGKKVYAITKNLTASSVVEFKDTAKKVYVSRSYYKPLISKINEMRSE